MRLLLPALAASALALPALGQVTDAVPNGFNEALDGDLSGDFSAPTSLGPLGAGAFTVSGSVFNSDQDDAFAPGGEAGDYDVLTFSLAEGLSVDSITLDAFAGGGLAFLGLERGTSLSVNTSIAGAAFVPNAAGLSLVGAADVATDLLPGLLDGSGAGQAPGSPLGTAFLPAGDFTLAIQNTGPNVNAYALTFNVVPEPTSAAAAAGLAGLLLRRRRDA